MLAIAQGHPVEATAVSDDPRRKYIDAALPLFAARGVHGTSISQVAAALGLSKQAMLHHFGSKDSLYLAVLETVLNRYESLARSDDIQSRPEGEQLEAVFDRLKQELHENPHGARLLTRELMDDSATALTAGGGPLRGFLDRLTDMALATPHWRAGSERAARAGVFLVLGALIQLAIAKRTLTQIYGEDVPGDMDRHFDREIRHLIATPKLPGI